MSIGLSTIGCRSFSICLSDAMELLPTTFTNCGAPTGPRLRASRLGHVFVPLGLIENIWLQDFGFLFCRFHSFLNECIGLIEVEGGKFLNIYFDNDVRSFHASNF